MENKITFGKCKDVYNLNFTKNLTSPKKDKNGFGAYMSMITENATIKKLFLLHFNIENKFEPNRVKAVNFVNENLSIVGKIDGAIMGQSIKSLSRHIDKDLTNHKYDNKRRQHLHESLHYLLTTPNDIKNVDKIIECKDILVDYIVDNESKKHNILEEGFIPNSLLLPIMVNKFMEHYPNISENEIKIASTIINNNDAVKKNTFEDIIKECLVSIEKHLSNNNDDTTNNKLIEAKNKLSGYEFNSDTYKNDIIKLLSLQRAID